MGGVGSAVGLLVGFGGVVGGAVGVEGWTLGEGGEVGFLVGIGTVGESSVGPGVGLPSQSQQACEAVSPSLGYAWPHQKQLAPLTLLR